VDINLSSDNETVHSSEPDTPADQKVLAGDDTGDVWVSSIEPTAPGPIGSSMFEESKPSTTDWVLVVPPSGKRGRKCPPPATK
jgi:hypothetical protein